MSGPLQKCVTATLQGFTVDCAAIFPDYSILFYFYFRKENQKTRIELQEMFKVKDKSGGKTSLGKPEGLTNM